MQPFRASAVQYKPGIDKRKNLAEVESLIAEAAGAGANLVALPELFFWSGPTEEERVQAEPVPGPTSRLLSEIAGRHSIYLVAGSILESHADAGEKCFNTCLLFGPDGALLAKYRKIHLFDIEIGTEVRANESRTRAAGTMPVCIETPIAKIGLAVCYDLRFPELFRRLADQGAELIVMPSAFTAPTGAAHWPTLVRARAIENQCYFIAPDQFGPTAHGFSSYGHSVIVDPWGTVLADAGEEGPCVITAELTGARVDQVRRQIPSLAHRRLRS